MKGLVVHPKQCVGCHTCELACAIAHEGECDPQAARLKIFSWPDEGIGSVKRMPKN